MNISLTRYEITYVSGECYQIGDYYTKVIKLYKKNKQSGSRIILSDDNYINSLLKQGYYIDYDALEGIIALYEEKFQLKFENINFKINDLNAKMRACKDEISTNKRKYWDNEDVDIFLPDSVLSLNLSVEHTIYVSSL